MVNAWKAGLDTAAQFPGASLKLGAAVAFDFFPTVHQIGEKAGHLLSDRSLGAHAQITRHLLTRPALDGPVGVEVRTVTGQVHQAEVQAGRGQISA